MNVDKDSDFVKNIKFMLLSLKKYKILKIITANIRTFNTPSHTQTFILSHKHMQKCLDIKRTQRQRKILRIYKNVIYNNQGKIFACLSFVCSVASLVSQSHVSYFCPSLTVGLFVRLFQNKQFSTWSDRDVFCLPWLWYTEQIDFFRLKKNPEKYLNFYYFG